MKCFAAPSPAASCDSSWAVAVDAGCWDWDSLCALWGGASLCVVLEEASAVELGAEGVALAVVLVQELVRQD